MATNGSAIPPCDRMLIVRAGELQLQTHDKVSMRNLACDLKMDRRTVAKWWERRHELDESGTLLPRWKGNSRRPTHKSFRIRSDVSGVTLRTLTSVRSKMDRCLVRCKTKFRRTCWQCHRMTHNCRPASYGMRFRKCGAARSMWSWLPHALMATQTSSSRLESLVAVPHTAR